MGKMPRRGAVTVRTAALTAALGAGLLVSGQSPSWAADVTRYEMNEPLGATQMLPVATGPIGTIGTEVRTEYVVDGATGYQFPFLTPNVPPAHPEHLVTVPDASALDPGTGTFTVSIRMRSTRKFGNLIQKGQARTSGGQWKFQMPNGVMQCLFRDANRNTRTASSKTPVNDGLYHTITCTRDATGVTMWVDGVRRDKRPGFTGNIDNTKLMSVGGKTECDQIEVTCDYFVGSVDWIEITKG